MNGGAISGDFATATLHSSTMHFNEATGNVSVLGGDSIRDTTTTLFASVNLFTCTVILLLRFPLCRAEVFTCKEVNRICSACLILLSCTMPLPTVRVQRFGVMVFHVVRGAIMRATMWIGQRMFPAMEFSKRTVGFAKSLIIIVMPVSMQMNELVVMLLRMKTLVLTALLVESITRTISARTGQKAQRRRRALALL